VAGHVLAHWDSGAVHPVAPPRGLPAAEPACQGVARGRPHRTHTGNLGLAERPGPPPSIPCRPEQGGGGAFAGQSGEAQAFPIQDGSLTAEVPRRRSIPQSTLRLKYSSTNEHKPHRYGSPRKGFYRLHPIALPLPCSVSCQQWGEVPDQPPNRRYGKFGIRSWLSLRYVTAIFKPSHDLPTHYGKHAQPNS